MGLYRRMLGFARPYWSWLIGAVILSAAAAALEAGSMYLIKRVMDEGFLNQDPVQARHMLTLLPLAIVGIMVLKSLFSYFADILNNGSSNRMTAEARRRVFDRLLDLPLRWHHGERVGNLSSRMTYDAALMQAGISTVVGRVIGSGLRIIGLSIVIIYLNWAFAVKALIGVPLALGPLFYFGRKVRKLSHRDQERMADLTALTQEVLSGIRVVLSFGSEAHERARFKKAVAAHTDAMIYKLKMGAASSPIMESIGGVGVAAMIYLAGTAVVDKSMTFGEFLALMGSVAALYPHFKALNGVNVTISEAMAAGARIFEILDTEPAVKDAADAREAGPLKQSLKLEGLQFSYEPGRPVLKGLDLELQAGQRVALVGPSGAGKSTLADLVPRFHDVDSGRILWDGQDIRALTMASLRRQIAVVAQETFLFNETIADNIAYGKPGATRQEIVEAAKAANADAFIREQAQGYDTMIGERGVRLSGGQRQRLAIARALLKDPPLLILDEATSALDTESERLVQQALERLMKGRSSLVIAHRLSTVQSADRIVVLEAGRVVQQGTHAELLAQGGLYKKLYEMQFNDVPDEAEAEPA
jgi:subfamily B ATP-binding cassette protein MsbA